MGIRFSSAACWDSPALGFDGTNYLVVWVDGRFDIGDIYGARVTPAGTVLDTRAISSATDQQCSPALAFDGKSFLVVWEDHRSGSQSDIYGARVAGDQVIDSAGIVISRGADNRHSPTLAFDGTNSLVVWDEGFFNEWDVCGARVTPGGVVFDTGAVVSRQGDLSRPRVCRGSGRMLLVRQGWAGSVGGKGYYAKRIWGKVDPSPAVSETTESEVRMTRGGATIIRGVLCVGGLGTRSELSGHSAMSLASLLDVSGRKVMDLQPGANDVRALAPGVYFVRTAHAQAPAQAIRKVVLAR